MADPDEYDSTKNWDEIMKELEESSITQNEMMEIAGWGLLALAVFCASIFFAAFVIAGGLPS